MKYIFYKCLNLSGPYGPFKRSLRFEAQTKQSWRRAAHVSANKKFQDSITKKDLSTLLVGSEPISNITGLVRDFMSGERANNLTAEERGPDIVKERRNHGIEIIALERSLERLGKF